MSCGRRAAGLARLSSATTPIFLCQADWQNRSIQMAVAGKAKETAFPKALGRPASRCVAM
jgi:hypothetical protein